MTPVPAMRRMGPPAQAAPAAGTRPRATPLAYLAAIPLSFVRPWFAHAIYVGVALVWLIPDRRIKQRVTPPAG